MSDIETEKWPQSATKEAKLFSGHYFGPDANSFIGILPSSLFYKDLSCLKNINVSQGKPVVGPSTMRPSSKNCSFWDQTFQLLTVLHQCCSWKHSMHFSLTLLTSQSPNCFISLISLSLPTGVTRTKSERISRVFSCSCHSSRCLPGKKKLSVGRNKAQSSHLFRENSKTPRISILTIHHFLTLPV